ncbi:MAG TPA: hypothetical protein VN818_07775 [Gammaproteobacteria bacterium]|nr:hypothetical protein [Gammaproteobacteria bacterium]
MEPASVRIGRALVAAAGVATLALALYRIPVWLDAWSGSAVVVAITSAVAALVLAVGIAVRGSGRAVERAATEISFLGCALVAAEAILLLRAPEKWSDDPLVQQLIVHEHAARAEGIAYDGRLPAEVVGDLQAQGLDAVPGFASTMMRNAAVATAIRERGLLPLSNVANAVVVECNEGPGYFQFRSDEFGFNNPPGLAAGPVDVAVIGESLALGHCVAPSTSAVDLVRARFPRTANFGIAGSRVLSQLGVFREYVEPLEPKVVVWFVNVNFAEPRYESERPRLMRYLDDASFSQGLRRRQHDVDTFIREVAVPMSLRRDYALREELEAPSPFPFDRVITLAEVRRVVDSQSAIRRPPALPDLSQFERAVDRVTETTGRWGGGVVAVILPSYELSVGQPSYVARYNAVAEVLRASSATVVDGVALFAAEPDALGLYTLRMDNHPNERGHALLAEALIHAIDSKEKS